MSEEEQNIYKVFRKKDIEKLRLMLKKEKEWSKKGKLRILCKFCRETGSRLNTAEDYYNILKGEGLIVTKEHKWQYYDVE